MVTFIHSADWQLGMTRHFLSDQSQPRFTDARLDAIAATGRLASDSEADFVVVCGDVFESNHIDRSIIGRAFDNMRATPDIHFYLLPGNHDPLDTASVYTSSAFKSRRPDNITVLDSANPVEVAPGVELIPAPWTTKRPLSDLVADACSALTQADKLRIVVGHGMVDTLSPDPDIPSLIQLDKLEQQLRGGLIQYVALGDRHSTTLVGETGRVWYAGAPEPTDYDELDPGNALVVSLDVNHCDVKPHSVGSWRFIDHRADLTDAADIDQLEQWLANLGSKDRSIIKLLLVGQISIAQNARLEQILSEAESVSAAIERWERRSDLVVLPDDLDKETLGLSGYAKSTLDELLELTASSDDEQAQTARDAIAMLYRLSLNIEVS